VQVGSQVGQDWLITSGLQAGDRVVIEGNGKLADGIPVHPHPAAAAEQAGNSSQANTNTTGPTSGGK
jgi:membrane fusion protein, multidrug efflux system